MSDMFLRTRPVRFTPVGAARKTWTSTVGKQIFFFTRRRGHTRFKCDWSSDVCSSDLHQTQAGHTRRVHLRAGSGDSDAPQQTREAGRTRRWRAAKAQRGKRPPSPLSQRTQESSCREFEPAPDQRGRVLYGERHCGTEVAPRRLRVREWVWLPICARCEACSEKFQSTLASHGRIVKPHTPKVSVKEVSCEHRKLRRRIRVWPRALRCKRSSPGFDSTLQKLPVTFHLLPRNSGGCCRSQASCA